MAEVWGRLMATMMAMRFSSPDGTRSAWLLVSQGEIYRNGYLGISLSDMVELRWFTSAEECDAWAVVVAATMPLVFTGFAEPREVELPPLHNGLDMQDWAAGLHEHLDAPFPLTRRHPLPEVRYQRTRSSVRLRVRGVA